MSMNHFQRSRFTNNRLGAIGHHFTVKLAFLDDTNHGLVASSITANVAAVFFAHVATDFAETHAFLYLAQDIVAANDDAPKTRPRLNGYAFASRLSYFLWSAPPDERLLQLAAKNELRENLAAEVRRMIGRGAPMLVERATAAHGLVLNAAAKADLVLAVLDDSQDHAGVLNEALEAGNARVLWLHNKSDLSGHAISREQHADGVHLWLSAKSGEGLEAVRHELAQAAGIGETGTGSFSARTRHLEALDLATAHLATATGLCNQAQAELAAEELRLAQRALGEITGEVLPDDLLGVIFSSFCIGK